MDALGLNTHRLLLPQVGGKTGSYINHRSAGTIPMTMGIFVGIDVGRINCGISVVKGGKFVYCAVASFKKSEAINDEVERLSEFLFQKFGRFDAVGIERQRAGSMRRIELHLEKAFEKFAKAVVIVASQSIKRYFGFSGLKKYADRKRVGGEKCMRLCKELKQMDMYFSIARGRSKADDIFDAMLIAYYVYAEPSVLKKRQRKKKAVNLTDWGNDRIWSVSASSVSSAVIPVMPITKKRKLGT